MKKPSDPGAERDRLRNQIIGLGERSLRKSYYPELKRRLEELERFRAALDRARDGIFVVDADQGLLLDLNESGARLLGASREDLLDTPLIDYLDQYGSMDWWRDTCLRTAAGTKDETGRPVGQEILLEEFGPNRVPVEMTLRFVSVGNSGYCVLVARDVTRRLKTEAAQRALEERLNRTARLNAVGTLAGGIAHDFNNLLMGIQGRVSLLQMDLEGHPTATVELGEIEDIVERATALTRQLLGAARGGKFQVAKLDLNRLTQETVTMFERTHKELRIETSLASEPALIEGDQSQIDQVLLNLLVNAAQAMPDGGDLNIEIRPVTFAPDDPGLEGGAAGDYVQLSVTDSGCGMADEIRRRIFDPFFTTKAMGHGTGLGLASVHGIVTNHGGFVTVYSELDVGTAFHVYLPTVEGREADDTRGRIDVVAGRGRILLVDDEHLVLDVSRKMLSKLGYEITAAATGEEALQHLDQMASDGRLPDAVILDLIMPGLSGHAVFEKIRASYAQLPVVLSSGYAMNGQAQTLLAQGCAGFLQKPFKISELSQLLAELLTRQDG